MPVQIGRVIIVWGLVASVLLASTPVLAAPGPSVASRVEKHNQLGIQYYREGKFPDAVREMLEAYRLIPDPGLLYNIAKIYVKMGETSLAITYFEKFVQSDEVIPSDVQKALETLQKLREKARVAEEKKRATKQEIELVPLPQKPVVKQQVELKPVPFTQRGEFRWLIAGSGGALLLASGICGLQASQAVTTFEKASGVKQKQDAQARARAWALGADINLVGGILSMGFAGYLWWDAETPKNKEIALVPVVGDHYVGVQWNVAASW